MSLRSRVTKLSIAALLSLALVAPMAPAAAAPEARLTLHQSSRNTLSPGDFGGFGMLAEYRQGGPRLVEFTRTTAVGDDERRAPSAIARVYDPTGALVAIHDFTEQPSGEDAVTLTVPKGPAGIYRFSFSGGRDGDQLDIALPETKTWGVRGEPALGVTDTTPRPAYLYIPRTSERVVAQSEGEPTVEFTDETGLSRGVPALDPAQKRNLLDAPVSATDVVWRVDIADDSQEILSIDGAPALLAPTAAAAERLRGGTVEADGLLVAGPLQARLRHAMVELAGEDLSVALDFPDEVPADLEDPIAEAQVYGKYGVLAGIDSAVTRQIVDPASPYLGVVRAEKAGVPEGAPVPTASWENFLGAPSLATREAGAFAASVASDTRLNPAFGDEALTRRAALAAMYQLLHTSGDDLIRENDLRTTAYPVTHAFFAYFGAAQTYYLIHDALPEHIASVFREALIAVGDRISDYKGYESNQWLHNIHAHHWVYLATGEERFLTYFERDLDAFLDVDAAKGSTFGQSRTGYYLEDHGPDGNYNSLNEFEASSILQEYRKQPHADPERVAKLRASLQADLDFQSLTWLPTPDGTGFQTYYSVSSMGARTKSNQGNPSYPGIFLMSRDFPLALARYQGIRVPAVSAQPGDAATYPFYLNDDAWARSLIAKGIVEGSDWYTTHDGNWTPDMIEAYRTEPTVEAGTLPVYADDQTWTLPGTTAWKHRGLYGLAFYDIVDQATLPSLSRVSGGPAALWSEGTGAVISSTMNNSAWAAPTSPALLSYTSVYGTRADGSFWASGKERSTFRWIEEGTEFEITAPLSDLGGTLTWTYTLTDAGTEIAVSLDGAGDLRDAYVNLPVLLKDARVKVSNADAGSVAITLGDAELDIDHPADRAAVLGTKISTFNGSIQPVRIPIPADGTPVTLVAHEGE